GVPFKLVPIIQHYRLKEPVAPDVVHTRSPEFLKVNPNGHVPSIDDGGVVLHESLAINLYLAKKHGGPLAPANVAEDGAMSMWSLWAVTEVEPHSLLLATKGITEPEISALRGPFAVLDKALAKDGYLVGGRFTVADINVAEIVRYAMGAPQLFDAAPNVKKWLAACQARPAFKTMWAARDKEPA
ncbi:MAG: glutathione S-transferase family protein, partial [Proteobacteria bacterium]|nr:glutathione S-transferase family protein [Pseudomonadota bacterium]